MGTVIPLTLVITLPNTEENNRGKNTTRLVALRTSMAFASIASWQSREVTDRETEAHKGGVTPETINFKLQTYNY